MQKDSRLFNISVTTREGEELSGPLNILWELIESYEVDIFDVSLKRITNDFLDYIRNNTIEIKEKADFALMGTRFIYYKSKLLLPNPGFEENDEIDDRLPLELVEQLLEYKKFQMVSEKLRELEESTQQSFYRDSSWNEYEKDQDYLYVDLKSFFITYKEFLLKKEKENPIEIEIEEFTVEELIENLREKIKLSDRLSFLNVIYGFSYIKITGYFLAILEMAKLNEIKLFQETYLQDIFIVKV